MNALHPPQDLEASATTILELTNHVDVIEATAPIVASAFSVCWMPLRSGSKKTERSSASTSSSAR
jgi:hypothetical protein